MLLMPSFVELRNMSVLKILSATIHALATARIMIILNNHQATFFLKMCIVLLKSSDQKQQTETRSTRHCDGHMYSGVQGAGALCCEVQQTQFRTGQLRNGRAKPCGVAAKRMARGFGLARSRNLSAKFAMQRS